MRDREYHGYSRTPEYTVWAMMIQRCCNPKHVAYVNYGGRGITVCERWRNSFCAFLADMGFRPNGLSIDRIDNDGNYEPGNCRWATDQQQSFNRRRPVRKLMNVKTRKMLEKIGPRYLNTLILISASDNLSLVEELREMIVLRAIDLGVITSRDIQTSGQLQPQE